MKKALLRINFFVILFALLGAEAFSQSAPPSNLSGSNLRTWLKQNWYDGKHNQLGYNAARTAIYSYVDSRNGTVYCVYTGFNQPAASTTYLNPINAEHTVPQSWFGGSEPMKSDIHHLYPTHGSVNSARSNHPFNEITDSGTDNWYGIASNGTYTTSATKPSSGFNAYSEKDGSVFEPREDHKGNLARAVFYFYTMYPTQAGSISDIISNGDLNVLYQWHLQDPVDADEITRNNRTEERQGNRNPYIDYPNSVATAWGFTPVGGNAPASPVAQLNTSSGSVALTWGDVSNETSYTVFRATGSGSFSQLSSLSANVTVYTDNSVSNGTTYSYYILAANSDGSNASNTVSGTPTSGSTGGGGSATELLISEYIEGSSNNKALEIANFTGSSVNLSSYSIKKQANGAGSWGSELSLSGTLANGDVYVVANSSASSTVTANADITTGSGSVTFNGNDPIGLFKNNTLIDVIGTFNGGSTSFAANQTLIRKASINTPSTSYNTAEWTVLAQDNFGDLGTHTMNGGTTPDPCNAPTGVSASSITSNSFNVSWSNVSGASSYDVEVNGSVVANNTTNTSANITGATASTTYTVRVRTNCSSESSSYTTINVTTNAAPAPSCSGVSISSFPYSESFESNLGAWTQGSEDDLNWTRDASGTPSGSTGPSSGAAGSYYMYVESSSPNYPSKTTYLDGPCVDLSAQSAATFSFGYHMYGSNMGTLSLQASTNNGSSWATIWSQSGNKGNAWLTADVNLSSYLGSTVKLRFVGLTGSSYRSDMAIDDLSITTGSGGGGTPPANTSVTLTLTFDQYPSETSWTLKNSSGTTVASGSGYSTANSTITEDFELPAGCYDFQITDSYGDGICCSYGNGSYALTAGSSTLASGGAYGSGETKNICVGSGSRVAQTGTTESKAKSTISDKLEMSIYPNPATSMATIQLSKYAKENLQVTITGIDGKLVFSGKILKDEQAGTLTIDVSKFQNGLYIVKVAGESFKQVSKLMVR